jgi:predicted ATP-dependent serine protease
MNSTTQASSNRGSGASGGTTGHFHARAFSGGSPLTAEIQAIVRFREGRQRSGIINSGVPASRVRQILSSVLSLEQMEHVSADYLRVDVHRPDAGRWQHDYGLSLGMAIAASLFRKSVGPNLLFLGDLDLQGRVGAISPKRVDRLNDALAAFEIETPVLIVCAPETATWVNSSSTVVVVPARTLADAVAAAWPGQTLRI